VKEFKVSPDHPNLLLPRIEELRSGLTNSDPNILSLNTGTHFSISNSGKGLFELSLWQQNILLTFPELTARTSETGDPLGIANQVMILYYFFTADGTRVTGQWISFSELPDGRFYNQAFQGYTGAELYKVFKEDFDRLEKAAIKIGGVPKSFADIAFSFHLLPRLPLLMAVWQGDEDFPASYQILFDSSVSHYLPTDVCAIAGSMLTRKLISVS